MSFLLDGRPSARIIKLRHSKVGSRRGSRTTGIVPFFDWGDEMEYGGSVSLLMSTPESIKARETDVASGRLSLPSCTARPFKQFLGGGEGFYR